MQDHVVVEHRRQQDQPPVERKRPRGGARAPAGGLVADAHLLDRDPDLAAETVDGEGQSRLGEPSDDPDSTRLGVGRRHDQADLVLGLGDADGATRPLLHLDGQQTVVQGDPRELAQMRSQGRLHRAGLGEDPLEPRQVVTQEGQRRCMRSVRRIGKDDLRARLHRQTDTRGPGGDLRPDLHGLARDVHGDRLVVLFHAQLCGACRSASATTPAV